MHSCFCVMKVKTTACAKFICNGNALLNIGCYHIFVNILL